LNGLLSDSVTNLMSFKRYKETGERKSNDVETEYGTKNIQKYLCCIETRSLVGVKYHTRNAVLGETVMGQCF
jgi:hypothetical protein